jgi:hypothetical protein
VLSHLEGPLNWIHLAVPLMPESAPLGLQWSFSFPIKVIMLQLHTCLFHNCDFEPRLEDGQCESQLDFVSGTISLRSQIDPLLYSAVLLLVVGSIPNYSLLLVLTLSGGTLV